MKVRTRFAPSPTGLLHIGGARTALFSWLFARRNNGEFVLRIEDTDVERSTGESLLEIKESLRWIGIDWDENKTLRQSDRLGIYSEYAKKLLKAGSAFKCYMTPEDLEGEKKKAKNEAGHFHYKREWAERGKRDEAPFALRFAVSQDDSGEVVFTDLLHGNMGFSTSDIEDFVIVRSDGVPTYNFASAIDDALTGITHVIRGDEHLVNTPKQILVLKALGFSIPAFVHLPVILAPDGSKLSKRHGAAASVSGLRGQGFLPSGVANYIARLGWSCGDEEIFTIPELIKKFDIKGLGTSPSNFDEKKMHWVNAIHIREGKSDVATPLRATLSGLGFDVSAEDAEKAYHLFRERAETVIKMAEKSVFLFRDEVEFDSEAKDKFINGKTLEALQTLHSKFAGMEDRDFNMDGLKAVFSAITEETGIKMKQMAQPLRVALTGKTESPGIIEVAAALGRGKTILRIEKAIAFAKSGE